MKKKSLKEFTDEVEADICGFVKTLVKLGQSDDSINGQVESAIAEAYGEIERGDVLTHVDCPELKLTEVQKIRRQK